MHLRNGRPDLTTLQAWFKSPIRETLTHCECTTSSLPLYQELLQESELVLEVQLTLRCVYYNAQE